MSVRGRGIDFALAGEQVEPNDLDLVVDASCDRRAQLIDALIELDASVDRRVGRRRLTHSTPLAWGWGWKAHTPFGVIDIVVRFIDDTTYREHLEHAVTVTLPSGCSVNCHPTRWAE